MLYLKILHVKGFFPPTRGMYGTLLRGCLCAHLTAQWPVVLVETLLPVRRFNSEHFKIELYRNLNFGSSVCIIQRSVFAMSGDIRLKFRTAGYVPYLRVTSVCPRSAQLKRGLDRCSEKYLNSL